MQLTVLGYILVPIFTYDMWWLVLLYAFFMLTVGCLEAISRPAYTYRVRSSCPPCSALQYMMRDSGHRITMACTHFRALQMGTVKEGCRASLGEMRGERAVLCCALVAVHAAADAGVPRQRLRRVPHLHAHRRRAHQPLVAAAGPRSLHPCLTYPVCLPFLPSPHTCLTIPKYVPHHVRHVPVNVLNQ